MTTFHFSERNKWSVATLSRHWGKYFFTLDDRYICKTLACKPSYTYANHKQKPV